MGRFRLCLHDYQRIRQADLKLDGLTVLCGVNGCGKSTLLRSLYYTVLGLKHYKAETLENYKGFLIELLLVKYDLKALFPAQASEDAQASALKTDNYPEFISTALHKLQPNFRTENYIKRYQVQLRNRALLTDEMVQAFLLELSFVSCAPQDELNLALERADEIFERYCALNLRLLEDKFKLSGEVSTYALHGLAYWFGAAFKADDPNLAEKVTAKFKAVIKAQLKSAHQQSLLPDAKLFQNLISLSYQRNFAFPEKLKLYEFDELIFENKNILKQTLVSEVFYLDSALMLGEREGFEQSDYIWRQNLAKTLAKDPDDKLNSANLTQSSDLAAKFHSVIKGRLNYNRKLKQLCSSRFEFQEDGGETFALKQAAAGIKSFASLENLLATGALDENSLLLIDEPEAHLHPQWIAYYAYLLTYLHQELKVNIVLSSHSPDFLNCLKSFSEHANLQAGTHFYLAEPADVSSKLASGQRPKYDFIDQGQDLSNIFRSFNRSYDVIDKITQSSESFANLDTEDSPELKLPWEQ